MADPAREAGAAATVRGAITALSAAFREAGIATPELDAKLLVLAACGLSSEAHMMRPGQPLSAEDDARISAFKARRLAREPVSRILGFREFWGRRFEIGPGVLDPRADSETLIEAALQLLSPGASDAPLRILDLGTGSGCLLLTLLAEWEGAWGVGADLDRGALAVARRNAEGLGLQNQCSFIQCDWSETFRGPFDVILSNPPYIESAGLSALAVEVRCYDPRLALNGGFDGLEAYRRIAADAARIAATGAWVLLETGKDQAADIIALFAAQGWLIDPMHCLTFKDLANIERVVAIKRQEGLS